MLCELCAVESLIMKIRLAAGFKHKDPPTGFNYRIKTLINKVGAEWLHREGLG